MSLYFEQEFIAHYKETKMLNDLKIEELLKDLPQLAETANDEMRSLLKTALSKLMQDMDLVYREEIDILKEMLTRTEQRVEQLEANLASLEN